MEQLDLEIFRKKILRHGVFWLTWIFSFTFIKSFGAPMEVYLAWFVYYIITLPVFIGHTYLIVYWLGRKFIQGYRIIFFCFLFLFSVYLFSCIELLITHELLAKWFPKVFSVDAGYLSYGNVLISGIGNLYIVLVFIAARMIRTWYLSSEEKKNLNQLLLEDRVAEANSRIQPGLLMYASEKIEVLAESGSESVSASIAILSEILNGTMLTREKDHHRIDEELKLIKQLTKLHALFNEEEAPGVRIKGADLSNVNIPALAVFSLLEILLRTIHSVRNISLQIMSGTAAFQAELALETREMQIPVSNLLYLNEQMDQFFPGRFRLKQQQKNQNIILNIEELPAVHKNL